MPGTLNQQQDGPASPTTDGPPSESKSTFVFPIRSIFSNSGSMPPPTPSSEFSPAVDNMLSGLRSPGGTSYTYRHFPAETRESSDGQALPGGNGSFFPLGTTHETQDEGDEESFTPAEESDMDAHSSSLPDSIGSSSLSVASADLPSGSSISSMRHQLTSSHHPYSIESPSGAPIVDPVHSTQSVTSSASASLPSSNERPFSELSTEELSGIIRLPLSSNNGSSVGARDEGEYDSGLFTGSSGGFSNASNGNQGSLKDQDGGSTDDSLSVTDTSVDAPPEIATVRFEHKVTELGHHIITGREGKLLKCEDEPIHVPGAIQGFGVLMAMVEDQETGDLVVRQVSENATEILGLSPNYLFSLSSFTDVLSESQEDILRDNIEYLVDAETWGSSSGSDNEQDSTMEDGPQIFLLSGFGQPGSSLFEADEEGNIDPTAQRQWTCWVAAHRPKVKEPRRGISANMVVLEFELERDFFNPLYPPFGTSDQFPSDSSGGSFSSGGSGGPASGGSSGTGSDSTIMSGGVNSGADSGGGSNSTVGDGSQKTSTPMQSDVKETGDSSSAEGRLGARTQLSGLEGQDYFPTAEELADSTSSISKPIRALEKMRKVARFSALSPAESSASSGSSGGRPRRNIRTGSSRSGRAGNNGVGTMDVFAVLSQINSQLAAATDLDNFLKIVVGITRDLTQFSRCLVYQFDEDFNGVVVAELVDWSQTHDLYKGLHFPAGDIPAQAREMYKINKVRLLYDRAQTTARLILRSNEDLQQPLDLTHSYLRAMSPIHLKYLSNMGVRSSMSISIMAFGQLWGLIACHSYGRAGMRVSFPVRQMLRLFSDSISRNIERLSYAYRLQTRKLISTIPSDSHPTGYIVSNAEDLLGLFDSDYGVLVIGEGAKILGPVEHGQEVLIIAEYLRQQKFTTLQCSQSIAADFPELRGKLVAFGNTTAGMLYVPLSPEAKDFVCFLRLGQVKEVKWAGKPYKSEEAKASAHLEPRASFAAWTEFVTGRCRAWTDEQMDTAGVLALVYGKFIEVWRAKENALKNNQRAQLILANASHEVRTPLNHIINYLELALETSLDDETRENLSKSHIASKSLLFTINDLLHLTRIETGADKETSFNLPFNLRSSVDEALSNYLQEAKRRGIRFYVDIHPELPDLFIGDHRKVCTIISNLVANALQHTVDGFISVTLKRYEEIDDSSSVASALMSTTVLPLQIEVLDTGTGMPKKKLETIFAMFESVERSGEPPDSTGGIGLGLAVVSRIVERLNGSLRADSEVDHGTKFTILLPLSLPVQEDRSSGAASSSSLQRSNSFGSSRSELEGVVDALSSSHMSSHSLHQDLNVMPVTSTTTGGSASGTRQVASQAASPMTAPTDAPASNNNTNFKPAERLQPRAGPSNGTFDVADSRHPLHSIKVPETFLDNLGQPSSVTTPGILGRSNNKNSASASESAEKFSSLGESGPGSGLRSGSGPVGSGSGGLSSVRAGRPKRGAAEPTYPMGGDLPSARRATANKEKTVFKYRAIIVDDDDINRRILSKRLEKAGHESTLTKNGQQSVDLVKQDRDWDVILMDLNMPILDGWGATEKIRKVERKKAKAGVAEVRDSIRLNKRIPLLAVSASCFETDRERMIEAGFDGWILKPIDNNRLQALLSAIFEPSVRAQNTYSPGYNWERGGFFFEETPSLPPHDPNASASSSSASTSSFPGHTTATKSSGNKSKLEPPATSVPATDATPQASAPEVTG